jgi:hypothetical protein
VFVPAPADPGTVPDGSSSPLGRYRLDLTLGDTTDPDCGFLPDEAKSRTYSAAVTFTLPLGFRVVLGDATFLGSPTCDSPEAGPGDSICHWLRYEFDGLGNEGVWLGFDPTPFVEQLSDGSWLQLTGAPYGPETSGGVNASGAIVAWHWPTDGGVVRHCDAPNARITLIRQ